MPNYILLTKTESRGNTVITFATPVAKMHEAGICQEMDVIRVTMEKDPPLFTTYNPNIFEWLYHKDGQFNWMPCPLIETPELVQWLNEQ